MLWGMPDETNNVSDGFRNEIKQNKNIMEDYLITLTDEQLEQYIIENMEFENMELWEKHLSRQCAKPLQQGAPP